MYNKYYGLQKDGTVLEFDQFMTVGKTYKWDYEEQDNDTLRIFNPTNNETIFIQLIEEVREYTETENVDWDEITRFINALCRDMIIDYYKKKESI